MMNYEIFKEVVKEKFMDYMPEKFKGMELVAEPVEKVNVTLDGIILREEGRNISPTIYINDMYKKYQECGDLEQTLMAACDFMERAYEQTPVVDVDSIMRDANEKIVFQLINTEQNKTFLEQVPHREFQDLSIVYKVIISADKDAVQSSKITNEFAKRLGMSEEQLFKCAAENTRRLFPPVVRSMNDIMKEMFAILTNQAYIGSAVHGKVVIEKYNNIPLHATDPSEWVIVENTHEPLVDKETFEKAQERVKEISDAYFAKEFTKHPPNEKNLLKGKIVCGDCGKGMRLSPRTTKSYVYFCGTFSDGINQACSRHKIDQEDVNKAVFAQISNHMRCCIDALRVIRELNARSSGLKKYDVYEKAITRQRRELEKVNRKFSELYGDYSEHLINESEYLTLKQQYLLKSEALKKEIDNLLISQNLYSKNYKIDADWENLINKYLKCRKLNKELADAFVDKVQVFEDGRISVNLVYDDCLEELLQVKNKREGDLNE